MITEFSAKTGIPVEDILGRSRVAHIAEAREMYYYLLSINHFHYSEIARLTDRTHGAVLHGINRIKTLLELKDERVMRLFFLVGDIKR